MEGKPEKTPHLAQKRTKKNKKERAKSSDLKDATNHLPLGCNELQNSNNSPAKKVAYTPATFTDPFNH